MQVTVDRLDEAYVDDSTIPLISPRLGVFVSPTDLIEVLEDYYANTLDEPREPHLICRPLIEWNRFNSLWTKIDSHQLGKLIRRLSTEQQVALRNYFQGESQRDVDDDAIAPFHDAIAPFHDAIAPFHEAEAETFLALQSAIDQLLAAIEQVL